MGVNRLVSLIGAGNTNSFLRGILFERLNYLRYDRSMGLGSLIRLRISCGFLARFN
jgi:hypothetical protein